jgi:hypothetical protein
MAALLAFELGRRRRAMLPVVCFGKMPMVRLAVAKCAFAKLLDLLFVMLYARLPVRSFIVEFLQA